MTQIEKLAQYIQMEILKNQLDSRIPNIIWQEYDGDILVTTNGFNAYKIPKDLWYIDLAKITPPKDNFKEIFKDNDQDLIVDTTGVVYEVRKNSKKADLIELENEKFKIYVDKKYFKPFLEFSTYKAKSSLAAVKIYTGDYLVGVVMPVNKEALK